MRCLREMSWASTVLQLGVLCWLTRPLESLPFVSVEGASIGSSSSSVNNNNDKMHHHRGDTIHRHDEVGVSLFNHHLSGNANADASGFDRYLFGKAVGAIRGGADSDGDGGSDGDSDGDSDGGDEDGDGDGNGDSDGDGDRDGDRDGDAGDAGGGDGDGVERVRKCAHAASGGFSIFCVILYEQH